MEINDSSLGEIKLIGISARTNTKAEMTGEDAQIAKTSRKFFKENISAKITNQKNPGVTYCVYADYESDYTGEYTYFIGCEVDSFDQISSDLDSLIIPPQKYRKITTNPGKMPDICIETWQKIWAMDENSLGGKRNYIADFEIYDERSKDPANTILDIYIGIDN